MRSQVHAVRSITTLAALLLATILPSGVRAQDVPYRPACQIVTEAAVSEAIGMKLVAGTESVPTNTCYWRNQNERTIVWVQLLGTFTLQLFLSQPGAKAATVAEHDAVTVAGQGMVVVALDDGGLLQVQVTQDNDKPDKPLARASGVAEAIFAAGPVTAQPPTRPEVEQIRIEGDPCALISLDEINTITGSAFTKANAGDSTSNCNYTVADDFSRTIAVSVQSDYGILDYGTTTSTVQTVAGRYAIWEAIPVRLSVDAGANTLLAVSVFGVQATPEESLGFAKQIAETVIPRMATGAPPLTGACLLITLAEITELTGLEVVTASDYGEGCFFARADSMSGVLLGTSAVADVETAFTSIEGVTEPTPVFEIAGHQAKAGTYQGGPAVAVDLDGLPDGDGKILAVLITGLSADAGDPIEIAKRVAERVISHM